MADLCSFCRSATYKQKGKVQERLKTRKKFQSCEQITTQSSKWGSGGYTTTQNLVRRSATYTPNGTVQERLITRNKYKKILLPFPKYSYHTSTNLFLKWQDRTRNLTKNWSYWTSLRRHFEYHVHYRWVTLAMGNGNVLGTYVVKQSFLF